LYLNLTRWGGLAAVVAAALLVIADLLTLFLGFGQEFISGEFFQSAVVAAGLLLLLGLVALYAHHVEAMGDLGLFAFLAAFCGIALTQRGIIWAPLVANLGWFLFGIVSLRTQVYPRAAAILLIIGALLAWVVNILLGSGLLMDNQMYAMGAVIVDIILNVAIGWLGFSLFAGRDTETRRRHRRRQL